MIPRALPALLALALALAACAPVEPRPESGVPIYWPQEPDPPRIAFVRAFSRPADLGIERGFLKRVADFVFGASESRLVRPMAVVEANGAVFVADAGAMGVHRFDPKADRYDLVGTENGNHLPSPVGLARGRDGEVYVTDSALAEVLVIRPGAEAATRIALPRMKQPTGIAFDPVRSRLYVVDTGSHRVNVFGHDGTPLASFGRRGTGDAEFNYPTQIWRDPRGRLYVTDSLNFRIQVFDDEGRFVSKFGQAGDATGDFMRQKGVATDSFGHVYIVDALLSALQIFDGEGRLLLSLGEMGQGPGEFWLPTGVFVGDNDMIFVADTYNQRIQVFRYIGGAP